MQFIPIFQFFLSKLNCLLFYSNETSTVLKAITSSNNSFYTSDETAIERLRIELFAQHSIVLNLEESSDENIRFEANIRGNEKLKHPNPETMDIHIYFLNKNQLYDKIVVFLCYAETYRFQQFDCFFDIFFEIAPRFSFPFQQTFFVFAKTPNNILFILNNLNTSEIMGIVMRCGIIMRYFVNYRTFMQQEENGCVKIRIFRQGKHILESTFLEPYAIVVKNDNRMRVLKGNKFIPMLSRNESSEEVEILN